MTNITIKKANKPNNKLKYFIIIASIALVAGLGSLFVNLGMNWFDTLTTPSRFVPNVLIPIVWTIIYITFAVILCIWASKSHLPKTTLGLLIANGIINVLWCLLFFTFNNTILGLVAIIFNLILAILLILDIYKQNKIYGLILSIYPIWVSIATTLNLALWILN